MKITRIKLPKSYEKTQLAREELAEKTYDLDRILNEKENREELKLLENAGAKEILGKLRAFEDLDFSESFVLMSYVIAGTNKEFYNKTRRLFGKSYSNEGPYNSKSASEISRMILEGFTSKETNKELTEEEIAGISSASLMDLIYRIDIPEAIDTCGMGADKGIMKNNKRLKTINVSTLSSIVIASLGYNAIKHGSYKNTAAMGSSDVAIDFGININQDSIGNIKSLIKDHKYLYTDAHLYKTIHDSSHLVKVETINHIIGPMTTPVSKNTKLHRVLGVNEKIHPRKIALAYEIMNRKGFQTIGNAAIVAGLDNNYDSIDADCRENIKKSIILDELSPFSSAVAFMQNGAYSETRIIKPEDFGITLDPNKIFIDVSSKEILKTKNREALTGKDSENAKYLAMNAALGLYVYRYGGESLMKNGKIQDDLLNHCYKTCIEAIKNGLVGEKITKYAAASQGKILPIYSPSMPCGAPLFSQ